MLVCDDDTTIAGSKAIIQWARKNPATTGQDIHSMQT